MSRLNAWLLRHCCAALAGAVMCFLPWRVSAQLMPDVSTLQLAVQREHPTGPLYIWQDRLLLRSDATQRVYLVCDSRTDPQWGRCPNAPLNAPGPSGLPAGGQTTIDLRMTEARTGQHHIVHLEGYQTLLDRSGARLATLPLNQTVSGNDGPQSVTLILSAEAQKSFPFGGIWRGKLNMTAVDEVRHQRMPWSVDLTVRVQDDAAIFLDSTHVDLNWQTHERKTSGHAAIEPCLYDGFALHHQRYSLKITDPASQDGRFQVRYVGAGTNGATRSSSLPDDAGRVFYTVQVATPGGEGEPAQTLRSGQEVIYDGMGKGRTRPVSLPGHREIVFCAPWRVHLDTPAFATITKAAGRYQGTLRIEFSAVTP